MNYAYIRVSGQKSYNDGKSLEEQRERILHYCQSHQIEEPVFIDEGHNISGAKESRKGFDRLKTIILKGDAKVVLVYDLSRLSRDLYDSIHFLKKIIQKKDVRLISVAESIDLNDDHAKQVYQMKAMANEWYREAVSKRMKDLHKYLRSQGKHVGGTVPFGFTLLEDGRLGLNKAEQDIIGLIKTEKDVNNSTYRGICQSLEILGHTTKLGKTKWNPKVVRSIYLRYK